MRAQNNARSLAFNYGNLFFLVRSSSEACYLSNGMKDLSVLSEQDYSLSKRFIPGFLLYFSGVFSSVLRSETRKRDLGDVSWNLG